MELADRLAEAMGRNAQEVWYPTYYGKRAVRSTLLAGQCDVYIGLPGEGDFMRPQVVMSTPFVVHRYALVAPAGATPATLAELKGRRVAVQLLTPPHQLLASAEGVRTVTVRSPEEGMRALAEGQADVAYLWGPSAGFLNRTQYGDRWRVTPTDGPDMAWPVSIGFRRADTALRERVQHELDGLRDWVAALGAKYGFPSGTPVQMAPAAPAQAAAAMPSAAAAIAAWRPAAPAGNAQAPAERPVLLASAGVVTGLLQGATLVAAADAAPAGGDAALSRGRQLFNTNCSHCHGPNAASPDPRIDLRKLTRRYGDDMAQVFQTTVHAGRPDKGMPSWNGVLPEPDIASIKVFIDSVQQGK